MAQTTWILLSDARAKLLKIWLFSFAIMTLFLMIQTITGIISGIEYKVWGWHFLCMFPVMFILGGSTWLKRHTDKMIHPNSYRAFLGLEVFYVTLVIAVFFLSRKAIELNDYGLEIYYGKMLWVLLPINFLLIFSFILVFLSKKDIYKPNSLAILQIAKEKADNANHEDYPLQASCFEQISSGNLESAIEVSSEWLKKNDSATYQDMVLLQGQYNMLRQEITHNTIGESESHIQLNKIMIRLLDIVKDIKA